MVKLKYKIGLILIVALVITLLINSITFHDKINYTALGDGLALGITPRDLMGKSFNDYYVEMLENNHKLASFNTEFIKRYLTSEDMWDLLNANKKGPSSHIAIKQILAKSDIITRAIGLDERVDFMMMLLLS